jgi:hypothetical protein
MHVIFFFSSYYIMAVKVAPIKSLLSKWYMLPRFVFEEYYLLGYNAASSVKFNGRLGGTCRLHLQGRRISQARNQSEAGNKLPKPFLPASRRFLAWLILLPCRWRRHVSSELRLNFNGLHGIIPQNIGLFITTAVGTSNPA